MIQKFYLKIIQTFFLTLYLNSPKNELREANVFNKDIFLFTADANLPIILSKVLTFLMVPSLTTVTFYLLACFLLITRAPNEATALVMFSTHNIA